ncbi:MAG: SusD/RagB family nutrient-binding outer membrane lipoprotein [Bacteroidota bacterium]
MKMHYKKILLGIALACAVTVSCDDKDYVEINTDPDILGGIPPENQFLNATISVHSQDFEAYYDFYRRIMPWMQYVTPLTGNGESFTTGVGNFSYRYGRLYNGVGNALVDLEMLVKKMPVEEQPKYAQMLQISHILKAYYAFYVSDIYGSIVYSEGFQARYGGTLLPKYDDQQTLFNKLDGELKDAVTALKATQPVAQISLDAFDQYYGGNVQQWVKAANALRVKIAMRMLKRDETKAKSIITEALSVAADLMSSNSDGWVLETTSGFTSGGNWNPDGLRATKPIVDFMIAKDDPRIDAFFAPNSYSQANINILIAAGKLAPGTTEGNRYVGSFTSPDAAALPANITKYYTARTHNSVSYDTLSLIQRRLFQPSFNSGTGSNFIPVITYAEFCFMRAELAARAITTENAKEFYDKGVTASIQWYDEVAQASALTNYTALTGSEITDYLAMTDIAYDPAKGVEQIACQSYLNSFRQPAEGWAIWKRTGFPSTTSVLALTDMKTNNVSLPIPRRAPLEVPTTSKPNYANVTAAYDAMAADPSWGQGPADAFGRVWWDKQ